MEGNNNNINTGIEPAALPPPSLLLAISDFSATKAASLEPESTSTDGSTAPPVIPSFPDIVQDIEGTNWNLQQECKKQHIILLTSDIRNPEGLEFSFGMLVELQDIIVNKNLLSGVKFFVIVKETLPTLSASASISSQLSEEFQHFTFARHSDQEVQQHFAMEDTIEWSLYPKLYHLQGDKSLNPTLVKSAIGTSNPQDLIMRMAQYTSYLHAQLGYVTQSLQQRIGYVNARLSAISAWKYPNQFTFNSALPTEMLYEITSFLDPKSASIFSQCNKELNVVVLSSFQNAMQQMHASRIVSNVEVQEMKWVKSTGEYLTYVPGFTSEWSTLLLALSAGKTLLAEKKYESANRFFQVLLKLLGWHSGCLTFGNNSTSPYFHSHVLIQQTLLIVHSYTAVIQMALGNPSSALSSCTFAVYYGKLAAASALNSKNNVDCGSDMTIQEIQVLIASVLQQVRADWL